MSHLDHFTPRPHPDQDDFGDDIYYADAPRRKLVELQKAWRFGVRAMNIEELQKMIARSEGKDGDMHTGEVYSIEGMPFENYLKDAFGSDTKRNWFDRIKEQTDWRFSLDQMSLYRQLLYVYKECAHASTSVKDITRLFRERFSHDKKLLHSLATTFEWLAKNNPDVFDQLVNTLGASQVNEYQQLITQAQESARLGAPYRSQLENSSNTPVLVSDTEWGDFISFFAESAPDKKTVRSVLRAITYTHVAYSREDLRSQYQVGCFFLPKNLTKGIFSNGVSNWEMMLFGSNPMEDVGALVVFNPDKVFAQNVANIAKDHCVVFDNRGREIKPQTHTT